MFQTVIVAIDPEVGARDVIAAARGFAPGARLLFTTVYPYPAEPGAHRHAAYATALRDDALTMLDTKRALADVDAEIHAIPGTSPAGSIKTFATQQGGDLIVIASSRRGGAHRFVFGDVAHTILNGAPCPVLVAPRELAGERLAVGRIGIAYDGSPESEHALVVAVGLTRQLNARLEVVQALDVAVVPEVWGFSVAEYLEGLRGPAEARLDEVIADLGVPVRREVVLRDAHTALAEAARHVDLMVCGSRGWGPAGRTAFGSVAERLMHHAAIPVLVVPRGSEQAVSRFISPAAERTPNPVEHPDAHAGTRG